MTSAGSSRCAASRMRFQASLADSCISTRKRWEIFKGSRFYGSAVEKSTSVASAPQCVVQRNARILRAPNIALRNTRRAPRSIAQRDEALLDAARFGRVASRAHLEESQGHEAVLSSAEQEAHGQARISCPHGHTLGPRCPLAPAQ